MINLRRTWAIGRKECFHVLRDVRSLLLALVLPVFLLVLFGYALTLDVDRIATVVYDMDRTPESRVLIERLRGSRYFQIRAVTDNYAKIERLIDEGECLMSVAIPRGYGRRLRAGTDTELQIILDGTDSNTASIALGYATALLQTYDAALRGEALTRQGTAAPSLPVEGQLRVWYNTELKAKNYIVPGLIALVMMIIGALLTSLTIAREYEVGTMEQLLSTPIRPAELVLGKIIPYYLIGMVDMAVAVVAGTLVFDVPLRGAPPFLFLSAALFMFSCLSMGLFISAKARSQTLAFQMGILTSFLPAFLLSGFIYAIENMPVVIRAITYLVPTRYFVSLLKGIFLKGVGPAVLWFQLLMLILFSIVVFRAAVRNVKGKLA